jgi:hypothetical protein
LERAAPATIRKAVRKRRRTHDWLADWAKPALFAGLGLVAVGLLALGVQYAVRSYHDGVALAGKSGDPSPVAVMVAGETLAIPANMIRFPGARTGGAVESVDLLLRWPGLDGYSADSADAFRDGSALAPLVYVTIAPRDNPLDSDGMLAAVYERFFAGEAVEGPSGLTGRRMTVDSGYRGEEVFYAPRQSPAFVARCLFEATPEVPATCIRDVNIGAGLSMLYRFNRFFLGDWQAMDADLKQLAARFLTEG